jgi:hypothetical protein
MRIRNNAGSRNIENRRGKGNKEHMSSQDTYKSQVVDISDSRDRQRIERQAAGRRSMVWSPEKANLAWRRLKTMYT